MPQKLKDDAQKCLQVKENSYLIKEDSCPSYHIWESKWKSELTRSPSVSSRREAPEASPGSKPECRRSGRMRPWARQKAASCAAPSQSQSQSRCVWLRLAGCVSSPCPPLSSQEHEEQEDGGRRKRCAARQGSYECRRQGIYPRQDLGSALSFSQHSYSERQIERESWNEGKDSGGETLSFSVNRVPNNPFLMKSLPSCPWTQSSGSQSSSPFTSCSYLSTSCSYSLLTEKRGNTAASHMKNLLSKKIKKNKEVGEGGWRQLQLKNTGSWKCYLTGNRHYSCFGQLNMFLQLSEEGALAPSGEQHPSVINSVCALNFSQVQSCFS